MTSENSEEAFGEEEFEMLLIEEVRKRPIFYNKADKNYCNNDMKQEDWDTVEAVINSMKDYYFLQGKLKISVQKTFFGTHCR